MNSLIGRSGKHHRPRGFFGAGVDEPNAKLQVKINGYSEPNINATEIELVKVYLLPAKIVGHQLILILVQLTIS